MGGRVGPAQGRDGGRALMGRFERLPPSGVTPRPAATVVLLRERAPGFQLLLMRRNRSAGFVPGAYVFPGGRVDAQDADRGLVSRLERLTPEAAAVRLALPDGDPPAIAYYLAAAREVFEEAAVLVARPRERFLPGTAAGRAHLIRLREHLLAGTLGFAEVLDDLGVGIDGSALEYIAHWITPEAETRRYDTRFFAALAPAGSRSAPDPREMTDSLWLSPGEALDRHRAGRLPMIFPTIRTLEQLSAFSTADAVLAHYRTRDIPVVMPSLVRTEAGVRVSILDE